MSEEQKMYEITVEGEFTSGAKGKDVVRKPFSETFTLPITGGIARMEIQNKLIGERLKSKHADYRGWRTCQIVMEKPVKDVILKTDVNEMNKEELAIHAVSLGLKVNVAKFDSIESAREAVLAEISGGQDVDRVIETAVQVGAAEKLSTEGMKYPQLKKLAGELGLDQTGKADALKARIDEHLAANAEAVPADDEFEAL